MEAKTTNDSQSRQTNGQPVQDIALLSTEEKTALLEKTLAELEQKKRELEIEAALDRVRTRAMAMQRSDELKDLIALVSEELTKLDFVLNRCSINIFDPETKGQTAWMSNPEAPEPISLFLPYHEHPPYLAQLEAWKNRQLRLQYTLEGAVKKRWDEFLFTETEFSKLPALVAESMRAVEKAYLSSSFNNFGCLSIATLEPLSEEHFHILLRFAKVFDLTYTRFNDLKQAEAQAREAQIEAALEKVRSRLLAMHKSDELKEVITLVLQKLQVVGIGMEGRSAIIVVFEEGVKDLTQYVASPEHSSVISVHTPYFDTPILNDLWNARVKGESFYSKSYPANEKNEYFNYCFENTELRHLPEKEKKWLLEREHYERSAALGKNYGVIVANLTASPLNAENHQIVQRFARVFEQAYVRFLDLQKAETQAREAQIEAALERVRARAMAMHKSDELKEVATELRRQMGLLGQRELETCAIHLYDESPDYIQAWAALRAPDSEGEIIQAQALFPKRGIKIMDELMEGYAAKKQDYVLINETKKAQELLEVMKKSVPEAFKIVETTLKKSEPGGYWSVSDFPGGALVMTTLVPPDDHSRALLRRFSNVFGLAYRRFVDLKQAEAQAREA
ncbi:MAG: hypothetical protein M3342_17365, partial [Bacteroidota bacterium]|nr:hypothetical protein [Bacteroidota bacterium]